MGKLFLSQRVDFLAHCLAEELEQEGRNFLLTSRIVLVPHGSLKQWLWLELAKFSENRGVAGYKIRTFEEWVREAFSESGIPSFFELCCALYKETGHEEEAKRLASLFLQYGKWEPPSLFDSEELFTRLFVTGPFRLPAQILPSASPPAPIHCFGFDFLSQLQWEYLSRAPRLSVYLFSPCVHFWEDSCSQRERKRLSRYWKQKGVSEASLEALDTYLNEAPSLLANWGKVGRETLKLLDPLELELEERYAPVEEGSLLNRVQSRLLHFEKAQKREESDASLQLFLTGASRFQEIEALRDEILFLVSEKGLCFSDIAVLASDLSAYSSLIELLFSEREIPYRIIEAPINGKSAFLQGLYRLLRVLHGGWNEEELAILFETPSFLRHLRWDREILESSRRWLEIVLREGVEALLDELVFLFPGKERCIETDQVEIFLSLFQSLAAHRVEGKKTLASWAIWLEQLAEEFLEQDEEEANFFQKFLRELRKTHLKLGEIPFPFELIEEALKRPLFGQIHPHHLHAVHVAPFSEGNFTVHKAIFLIGMDEESWPKRQNLSSLHLLRKEAMHTLLNPSDQNRYLFLRTLFAATEFLYISYSSVSREDGKQIGPSSIARELLDSAEFKMSVVRKETPAIKMGFFFSEKEFKRPPLSELPEGEWQFTLSELSSLARNPWRFYLQKKFGLLIRENPSESIRLQKALLLRSSLQGHQVKGKLPLGFFKEAILQEVEDKAAEWKKRLFSWGLEEKPMISGAFLESCRKREWIDCERIELPPLAFSLAEGVKVRVVGELRYLSQKGYIHTSDAQLGGLLKVWPECLAAALALEEPRILCLKTGAIKEIRNPEKAFKSFLAYALSALDVPSPLFPEWADTLLRGKSQGLEKGLSDATFNWVASRAALPQEEEIKAFWEGYLREAFAELIELFPSKKKEVYAVV